MSETERRYTKVPVELRARSDKQRIGGYAAVFNRQSSNLGGFVEVVDAAAFNASRGDGWPDVIARYNHDDNMLLGSTGGGTLRLAIDGTGLDYEVDPPAARADILELVQRGDVRKSSFAFRTIEDEWGTTDQGFPMRTLHRVQLVDVAPVNVPAYPDSTAGLRSLAQHVGADIEEVRAMARQDELRRFFQRSDRPSEPKKQTLGAAARIQLLARKQSPYQ
ncbi:HK97 family phage prohead protease [Streptomyces sp. WMMC897]|uniref:HK97 family phage prohead protease n=1 Tax=Streptomyces sp. WMMC897 TaxID=3014782 RepID=UPI0022B6BC7A|nr:HK97 family phage prohead protease [Streptomyces sp. WMMC897]MCZ7413072.1 HK97 family phage prohead protease [Streptomyces sp. WMMC897]MCZ7415456.1 HK97 family phage prohead protease [Streptomyces sp. WMMC897]